MVSALVALVIYPVCFASELSQGNRPVWEFGWVIILELKHRFLTRIRIFKTNLHFYCSCVCYFTVQAYGVAWGAAIFLFGASVLLMCDKEAEEVYYKERDVRMAEKAAA